VSSILALGGTVVAAHSGLAPQSSLRVLQTDWA
jgi:hypothetical protein